VKSSFFDEKLKTTFTLKIYWASSVVAKNKIPQKGSREGKRERHIYTMAEEKSKKRIKHTKELILAFDGGSRNNPGPSGSGWVIYEAIVRDDVIHNNLVAFGYKYLGPKETNNVAEWTALLLGLRFLAETDLEYDTLKVTGDSKLVIMQMAGLWKCKALNLIPLKIECKTLINRMKKKHEFVHQKRDLNEMADLMSNVAMDTQGERITRVFEEEKEASLSTLKEMLLH